MPSLPAPPARLLLRGLLLLLLGSRPAGGAGPDSPALPIRSEKEPLPVRGAAGCFFGGKVYALDETWHPDLGEPFGVMRCVLCACEAPQWGRRGRGPGRVSCKNIKPQCPTLACRQPRQLPGHCCQTCSQERSNQERHSLGLSSEYPRDPEHRSYSDRRVLGAGERMRTDSHTDFVALLTGPRSPAVARVRVSLLRSSLRFSISYQQLDRPSRVRFSDSSGSVLFEHPAVPTQDGLVCGVWRAMPRLSLRLLRAEQLHVALVTSTHPSGEVWGPLIRHRALAAETFSAILTVDSTRQHGVGGIALLTLSDTEDSLHFLLLFRGMLEPKDGAIAGPTQVPLKLRVLHRGQLLRELQASASAQDPGFAEVLPSLTDQEMDWLVLGELQMVLERVDEPELRISGHVAARQSCDVLQSVLCGADALIPVQTGAAGSASLTLLGNGSLIYQVQVVGTGSEVVAMTLETKPQQKNQRTVLCHMVGLQPGRHMVVGVCPGLGARGAHMLLQNELFLNVGTKDFPDGELRGHVAALSYSGHSALHDTLPVPLAGALILPPVRSQAAGHAWLSLDTHCHLHYEVLLAGLGGSEQGTVTAHLLGPPGVPGPRRLLKGFYGSEAQGVVKDLEPELLRHLEHGTASLLITTKNSPRGELRGQVHVANQCEAGGLRLAAEGSQAPGAPSAVAAVLPAPPAGPGPDIPAPAKASGPGRPRDPNTCFFEGQLRPHGARWAPNYDPLCSLCTCQRRTVICDPVVCPPPSCQHPVQALDQCCPVCPEKQDVRDLPGLPRSTEPGEGCYFDGDRSWRAAGTRWHPIVPPFGLIKCAVCTCKGGTGEVHCEKVQCPRLACAQPVRANPTDCCKQCPAGSGAHAQLGDPMQADGPRGCRFAGQWFPESQSWHPSVPPFGEMSCITCRCGAGVPHCERDDCPLPPSCDSGKESRCCSHCTVQQSAPEIKTTPELEKEAESS
uniref:chordin isoform X1 n=1 Tax=Jaculus jaculus TaxID=51337 RepID=UPI001E1B18D5|nr:chordin isoform X1 [Jaculus jaculus]